MLLALRRNPRVLCRQVQQPVFAATSAFAAEPCRCLATAAAKDDDAVVIYEGPLNAAVKRIRLVSLTTLATSLMLPPMALIFKSSATVSLMGKVAVGGTAMVAGVGSTAALHFCTLPFVFEMSREGDRIVATRMDILARRTTFEFGVDDIKREPTTLRPFVTFEADGESFFVTKSGFLEEADADRFGAAGSNS
jgi:hypothetical protein